MRCFSCKRRLRARASIARGYGPVCWAALRPAPDGDERKSAKQLTIFDEVRKESNDEHVQTP